MTNKHKSLDSFTDEELLNLRLCDLPITISGTWLEDRIEQLYKELAKQHIAFRPPCYFADEWLTPQGETCIGIPFYLAHPALMRLEKNMMHEVRVYNALGKLKKVISLKALQKRSDKVLADPKIFCKSTSGRPRKKGLTNNLIFNKSI